MHDSSDWVGGLPRRAVRRRGAGGGEHPAHGRRLRLHAGHTAAPRRRWCPAPCCRRCRRPWHRRRTSSRRWSSRARPAPLPDGAVDFAGRRRRPRAAWRSPRTPWPTRPPSGSIRRAPPASPRARCTPTPTCTGRPSCTARTCWACASRDVCFSAAKLFFAYGLGNALTFPLSVGATRGADGRAAHAAGHLQASDRKPAHGVLRRAHRLRRHAGLARSARARPQVSLRLCSSAGEALPRDIGERWTAPFRLRDHRRHRLHRDAAHLPVEPARRRALRHHRQAGAGLRDRAARRRPAKS